MSRLILMKSVSKPQEEKPWIEDRFDVSCFPRSSITPTLSPHLEDLALLNSKWKSRCIFLNDTAACWCIFLNDASACWGVLLDNTASGWSVCLLDGAAAGWCVFCHFDWFVCLFVCLCVCVVCMLLILSGAWRRYTSNGWRGYFIDGVGERAVLRTTEPRPFREGGVSVSKEVPPQSMTEDKVADNIVQGGTVTNSSIDCHTSSVIRPFSTPRSSRRG